MCLGEGDKTCGDTRHKTQDTRHKTQLRYLAEMGIGLVSPERKLLIIFITYIFISINISTSNM